MVIADDFGLGRQHDAVILTLLASQHLDGTSVMIDGDIDPHHVRELIALRDAGSSIGLHLNLTHRFHRHAFQMPLGRLLMACSTGRLPAPARLEFRRQCDAFVETFGFLPDFYDGHQHCHCFPGLAAVTAALPRSESSWIRIPLPATPGGRMMNLRAGGAKVLLIYLLAAMAKRIIRKAGWPVNSDFSGFLKLDRPDAVQLWLPRLLDGTGPCDGSSRLCDG